MQLLGHRVPGGAAEFGIRGQYLDSELHLVDHSLSVGLVPRPQFEIADVVIQTVAVFVVYALKFGKRATQMLRHYVAVFEYFAAASKIENAVPRGMDVPFLRDRAPRTAFVATFSAAKFLAFVVARMFTVQRLHKTAFFGFTTQLALKSRGGFFVHEEQLLDPCTAVKGVS
jgi:hypothetical protein